MTIYESPSNYVGKPLISILLRLFVLESGSESCYGVATVSRID